MKKLGFSLIEVIIGLLIGSFVSIMVYQVFAQTTRVTTRVSSLVDDYADTFIMSSQMERDLTGIILLVQSDEKTTDTSKKNENNKVAPTDPDTTVAASAQDTEEKAEETVPFFCTVKENKLISLSFITTNALPRVDEPGSRLVRVRYFLEPQRGDPSFSQLMREEVVYSASKMASSSEKKAYPLMSYIETLGLTFYVFVPESEDVGKEIALTEWGTEAQKSKIPLSAPEFVTINGTYRSRTGEESIPFSLSVSIPAAHLAAYDYYDRKEKEKKKNNASQAQPGGAKS